MLGNRQKQDEIREKNESENAVHCDMLKQTPNACDGCPKNPFNVNKVKENVNSEIVEKWQHAIEYGIELCDLADLGLLGKRDDLSPEEVIVMRSMLHYRKVQDLEFLADSIASRLFFGGK